MQVNSASYAFRFLSTDQGQASKEPTDFLSKFQRVFSVIKHRLTQLMGFLDKTERLAKQDPRQVVALFKDLQTRSKLEDLKKVDIKNTVLAMPVYRPVVTTLVDVSKVEGPREFIPTRSIAGDQLIVWETPVEIQYKRSFSETRLPEATPIVITPKLSEPVYSATEILEKEALSPRTQFNDLDCVCINLVQHLQAYQGTVKALLPADHHTFGELTDTLQSLLVQSGMHYAEGGMLTGKRDLGYTSGVFKQIVLAAVSKSESIEELTQFLSTLPVHPYKTHYLKEVFMMDLRLAKECLKKMQEDPYFKGEYLQEDMQKAIQAIFSHYTVDELTEMRQLVSLMTPSMLKTFANPVVQDLLFNGVEDKDIMASSHSVQDHHAFALSVPIMALKDIRKA